MKKESTLSQSSFHDINLLKAKLLELLYWISIIFMWFGLASSAVRTMDTDIKLNLYVHGVLALILLVVFILRKRISYLVKSYVLISILYILAIAGMYTFGLLSQSPLVFLLMVVLSVILLNLRSTILIYAIALASYIAFAILFVFNFIPVSSGSPEYGITGSNWVMGISIFIIVTSIIIFLWEKLGGFLIEKIQLNHENKLKLEETNFQLQQEIKSRTEAEFMFQEQMMATELLNVELHETNVKLEHSNILLQDAKEKVQAADNLKASFLSNMSHEIRTPMNAIIGFSSLLMNEGIGSDDFRKYINVIQTSSNSLLNVISDIVNMSKIEAKQFTLYPELIELNAFLEELTERYTRELFVLKGNNVEWVIAKNISNPCQIISDYESLRQICNKIIDNSIKFTEKGKIILKTTIDKNGDLIIAVKDTGIGIDEDKALHIYDSFRQIDGANTRRYGGTGLGLSIAKGLVTLLNGTIHFNSKPNEGCEFTIKIPVIEHSNFEQQIEEKEVITWKGQTVLIIGKSTWDNKDVNQILQKTNASLLYVETGFQGIETCQNHPEIKLIIMDTILPDMSSFEVATMLKMTNSNIPIVAHLHNDKIENQYSKEQLTWDDIIQTPINNSKLMKTLERFLGR